MRGRQLLPILILVCASSGCIHMHPTRSGFLADYSQLEPVDKRAHLQVKPVDPYALMAVDSFYIEPVAWLADDMGQPANSEGAEEAISTALYDSLEKELKGIRPIVDEVGPHTAIVRSAVTGIRESQPIVNAILIAQIVGPLFNGGASAEIEIIDPEGRQIAAQSVAYRGRDWDLLGFFWRRRHPESAMHRAAEQLAGDLQFAGEVEVNTTEPQTQPAAINHPAQESFRMIR
jgi:hypothetical protein